MAYGVLENVDLGVLFRPVVNQCYMHENFMATLILLY